ncbi:hypothetical protein [Myxococcus sp. XM-1-1-1]|uniref:hypothetical protein n=2 Tax=unclassified Myxococcus TaxID=2648731 RepID=UPI001CBAB63E|nr:hypothetical protein [Myxococcus sp. XM-1-1-1]BDT33298.1 hypothetical protein MFMH1_29670 [Myxococcus sp. MH1]
MDHMPYESMEVGDEEPGQNGRRRSSPEEEAPGRTPKSAEAGGLEEERRMPQEEPGKTPGSAEGEDPAPRRS